MFLFTTTFSFGYLRKLFTSWRVLAYFGSVLFFKHPKQPQLQLWIEYMNICGRFSLVMALMMWWPTSPSCLPCQHIAHNSRLSAGKKMSKQGCRGKWSLCSLINSHFTENVKRVKYFSDGWSWLSSVTFAAFVFNTCVFTDLFIAAGIIRRSLLILLSPLRTAAYEE